MKRTDFPLIADVLFYGLTAGFLTLCILRYLRVPLSLAATLAALFALATALLVFLFLHSRRQRRAVTKKAREARDALMLHLALEKSERVRADLLAAYCADGQEAHLEGDEIKVDGIPHIPLFTMQPVSADAVAHLIRTHGTKGFVLLCNDLTPEAEKLLSSFNLKSVRADGVYSLFEQTDTVPNPLICGEIPRKTAKIKLVRAFSKRNARPFLVSGLLLLFMSLFTFFPVYYLVTGSALLLCAVFVRAFGYA